MAGAGSGKTRVLTRRIAHLLATGDAAPWEILAITFTNKAADEMRRRVVELVGPRAERMWVSTFHSACLRILRSHADRLGYRSGFTVYDDTDSRRLVELVMTELGLDTKRLPPRAVAAVIGQAKAELRRREALRRGVGDGSDPFRRRIADVYLEYQQRLVAANAMDFDDLLLQAVRLLRSAATTSVAAYQQRFRHILVDEYQDTNRAQNELVLLLGSGARQRLRGRRRRPVGLRASGAPTCATSCSSRRPSPTTTVVLEQNYRSTQTILDAANAVIANNLARRAQAALHRGGPGRADPPLPGRGRARRGGRGWRPRSGRLRETPRRSPTATWPSSTAPTPRAGCSRRSWCGRPSPTR